MSDDNSNGLPPPESVLDYAARSHSHQRAAWFIVLATIAALAISIPIGIRYLSLHVLNGPGGEPAGLLKCTSNLKSIGNALIVYSNEHRGQFADSLSTLLIDPEQVISADNLICPETFDTPAAGPTTAQSAASLNALGLPDGFATSATRPSQHVSYIYLGRGLQHPLPSNTVVAYEPLSNHSNGRVGFLFSDAHVEHVSQDQADKIIAELKAGHNPPRPEMVK